MEQREKLGSRLGFILLSAGCAIGVGNVWKFPYMVGQGGGGAFVLLYIVFLILLGIPVMTMEFSIGRAAQTSPLNIYKKLKPEKKTWRLHSYASLVANIMLMMFYLTIAGWILNYFVYFLTGKFNNVVGNDAIKQVFYDLAGNPVQTFIYSTIVIILGALVCSFSLQGGLERVTKYLMIALLAIMAILAIRGCTMPGAAEGLTFYLKPVLSNIDGNVAAGAMNQAFFTLSLGIGSMAIFGSYIGKERRLMGESINIISLDTFVALVAGLIIFPACFTYGINPDAGPNLIFITLPAVFTNMKFGNLWGALFFLFMAFAAFSTVLAVFENILAMLRELTGWSKKKTSLVFAIAMTILAIPCNLGFNLWSGFQPFGLAGKNVLDLEDFIVNNTILPLGCLTYVIFCSYKFGWGWDKFMAEANEGKGLKFPNWAKNYCKFVLPLAIIVIFVIGMLSYFGIM